MIECIHANVHVFVTVKIKKIVLYSVDIRSRFNHSFCQITLIFNLIFNKKPHMYVIHVCNILLNGYLVQI